jgi:NodT family efflux transporter outer membrane factor (OMF) lipoprotein
MPYRSCAVNRVHVVRSGRTGLWVAAVLSLMGCTTVGPDFKQPAPPTVAGYTAKDLPAQTAATPSIVLGDSQRFVSGQNVPAQWWQNFGSSKLNALIDQALRASPSLAAAQATLRQAQQSYEAEAGASQYPQVDADLGAQRQHSTNANFGQRGGERTFSLYNAGIKVSYNLDVFGGNRRALESLAAQADYQRYQLEGARQTLAANIVTAAMAQAQYAAQIGATEAILAAQQSQVDIAHKRFELGAIARGDELSLQTQLEQTRASLPPLRNQLQQTNHLLAVLVGEAPGAANIPQFSLSDFTLPADIPLLVPSELVRQRPDIQASEALLRAANADYGVAISKSYPQINLSASLATQALATSSLFGPGSMIWSLVGQVAQPLFNGGLQAGVNAKQASFDAAAANYQQSVLQGLRNVADVLRALDNGAQTLQALAAANAAAQTALDLIQQQYQLGSVSYLQLLTAQQQAQQTRVNLIAAQTQRLSNTAALYQAMGGGWANTTNARSASASK